MAAASRQRSNRCIPRTTPHLNAPARAPSPPHARSRRPGPYPSLRASAPRSCASAGAAAAARDRTPPSRAPCPRSRPAAPRGTARSARGGSARRGCGPRGIDCCDLLPISLKTAAFLKIFCEHPRGARAKAASRRVYAFRDWEESHGHLWLSSTTEALPPTRRGRCAGSFEATFAVCD